MEGRQPISVTTSWAVPANYTTFRLSEYFGRPTAFSAPDRSGPGTVEELVVDSGATNEAKTRTDELAGTEDVGVGNHKADDESGLLNILVQAL